MSLFLTLDGESVITDVVKIEQEMSLAAKDDFYGLTSINSQTNLE
jgi:hypothetical protein